MRADEISAKKLVVFDIDDTLVHTQTKVHVINTETGEVIDSLNSHDFTHYRLKPGEEFDFSGFRNAREFFEKSKPIIPMMRQLKQDIATGNKVVMVTARADFDDKELFLDTFRKYGIDMGKVHVYRAGNSKEGTTEERKKQIIKRLLDQDDYAKAIMYDDAKPNLHTFIELKKDHPRTRFYAWHVDPEGRASEYMREDIQEDSSGKLGLLTIIKNFVQSPIGQKYKRYDCKTVTRAFINWAEKNNISTEVINLAPPSAEFIKKNPQFKGKSGEGDGHIMPIVDGQAIDFTVRQFGGEFVNRPFEDPLITPVDELEAVYGRFGYFTDRPEWFLGGKTHWIGPLNQIPAEIFNQEFGDEILEQGVSEGRVIHTHLWHGSRNKHPVLEPRQAVDTGGAAGSNQNAIYATADPKIAIAMGLTTAGSDTGMFPNDPQMVLFSGKIRKGEYVYLHRLPMNGPDGKPQFVQGGNSKEFHSVPGVNSIKPIEIKAVPVNKYLSLIRKATREDWALRKKFMKKQSVAEGVTQDFFNRNFSQIDSVIKQNPKKILDLLIGMFPNAKEAIVNQYNDEEGMPFSEWRRVIYDIDDYMLSGPVVVNGSRLPIDPESEADRLAKYQQYIQDKDSGRPAQYFRANDSDPRTIDFSKLPPITIAQTDRGMVVTDGNHRAFLAKMANKPLRAYVWKRQSNNHPNVAKIKALFSNQQGVSEGIDPNMFEELDARIITRAAKQIVPTARARRTAEGYVHVTTEDGLDLYIGAGVADGVISVNIGSGGGVTTSGAHKGAVTDIIRSVYNAAVRKYGRPDTPGELTIDHDAGHGVWQHIADKLGLRYAAVEVKESGVIERKKTKRKSRWAAYGPGPFGGYGFAAGYSGDGGIGENQDLTELNVAATLKFIKDAHGDQLYGKLPYWRHPRAVAMTGRRIFGSRFNSDAVKAAFLHDAIEDTSVDLIDLKEMGFSDRVVDAVSLLTKDSSLTYFQNIDRIIGSGNEIAQMVKYADNYENYTSDKSGWAADRAASSNEKYLKSLNKLGDHLGVKHHIDEASYPSNIGAMETIKFYKLASDEEKQTLKELINKGKLGLAWHLIQRVTGVKLQGREFEIGEGLQQRSIDKLLSIGLQGPYQKRDLVNINAQWRRVLADVRKGAQIMVQNPRDPKHSAWIAPEGGGTWMVGAETGYMIKSGPGALEQMKFLLKPAEFERNTFDDGIPEDIDEGWRDIAAGLALGAGVGLSGPASANFEKIEVSKGDTVFSMAKAFGTDPEVIRRLNNLDKDFTIKPGQVIKVPKIEPLEKTRQVAKAKQGTERKIERPKIGDTKTLTGKPFEALLTRTARSSGITDPIELAAFLAQTSVETGRFKHMREVGNKERIERMYDLKFNRQGAKILGNTKPGDGWRYRGRGFIQLTGRDNYTRAGRDLGLDLAKDPDLVARDPSVAARASVWYWKTHVRPQVTDFRDTAAVTKAVQGGSSALDRREREFQNFKQFKLSSI